MDQRPPGDSVLREGLWVIHRDLGRLPLVGKEESISVVGATVIRDQHTTGQACASCSRTLVKPEDFYAVCVCCEHPICSEQRCQVFCAEETCGQAVCARCRRRIGETEDGKSQYLCLPHFAEWEREWLIIGIVVVVAAAILVGVLFFWMR